jgi:hypothetical protein
MIIDCDACVMDGTSACADCIVTVLLHEGQGPVSLISAEENAISNLADAGLVAPLRMVPRLDPGRGERRSAG